MSTSLHKLPLSREVEKYLTKEENDYINKHDNKPNAILKLTQEQLREVYMKKNIDSYRYTIIIFMILLPFGLIESVSIFSIQISFVVVLFFSMIDLIARYMQDPFENRASDTPMTTISRTFEINLLQMIDEKDIPEKIQPDKRGIFK